MSSGKGLPVNTHMQWRLPQSHERLHNHTVGNQQGEHHLFLPFCGPQWFERMKWPPTYVCQPRSVFPGVVPSGRTHAGTARWSRCQSSLSLSKPPLVDTLFLFICSNLSSDQAGSPLIISVILLHKPVQRSSVFLKITVPEIELKKEEILSSSQGLAGVLTGRSHQLCRLSSFAQNHKRTFRGKFLKRIQVGSGGGEAEEEANTWSSQLRRTL